MKKVLSCVFAAILICGSSVFSSCSANDDNPIPQPEVTEKLSGSWFAEIERNVYGETEIVYVLFNFGEDGVVTTQSYFIYPDEPFNNSWRYSRHAIYTVDESAGTIVIDYGNKEKEVIGYTLSKNGLTLIDDEEKDIIYNLHRPTSAELNILAVYDHALPGDEYIGKWFGYKEDNGEKVYTMFGFTDDNMVNLVVYLVKDGKCTRKVSRAQYEDSEEDGEPVLKIYSPWNKSEADIFRWSVTGNVLSLENLNEEDFITEFHFVTPADLATMAELGKIAEPEEDEGLIGKWYFGSDLSSANYHTIVEFTEDKTMTFTYYTEYIGVQDDKVKKQQRVFTYELGEKDGKNMIYAHEVDGDRAGTFTYEFFFGNLILTEERESWPVSLEFYRVTSEGNKFIDSLDGKVSE